MHARCEHIYLHSSAHRRIPFFRSRFTLATHTLAILSRLSSVTPEDDDARSAQNCMSAATQPFAFSVRRHRHVIGRGGMRRRRVRRGRLAETSTTADATDAAPHPRDDIQRRPDAIRVHGRRHASTFASFLGAGTRRRTQRRQCSRFRCSRTTRDSHRRLSSPHRLPCPRMEVSPYRLFPHDRSQHDLKKPP